MINVGSALTSVPVSSHATNTVSSIWGMVQGDETFTGMATQLAADTVDLTVKSFGFIANPINAMAAAGVDFLIALIQPLENALQMVTGNIDQMQGKIGDWEKVGAEMQGLAEEVQQVSQNGLGDWHGLDAAVAAYRIDELGAAIYACGHNCGGVSQVLGWAQAVCSLAEETVKAILSALVEWLIYLGVAAIAAAPFTAGSSIGVAAAKGKVQAAMKGTQAFKKVKKALEIFGKLGEFMTKMMSSNLWSVVAGVLSGAVSNAAKDLTHTTVHSPDGFNSYAAEKGGSLVADMDGMANGASQLEELSGRTDTTVQTAKDHEAEDITWGLVGSMFANSYNGRAQELLDQMDMTVAALKGDADLLNTNAEDWAELEREQVEIFEVLEEQCENLYRTGIGVVVITDTGEQ